jgi:sigma-E factor negative regulatory protein RseC
MIEETGVVISIQNTSARITVQKRGSCEGCAASGVCEPSENGMEIEALNPVHAKVGQKVMVSLKPQAYLKGALFIYGFPLAAFIAGIVLGKNLGETYFTGIDSDTVSVVMGFAALIGSFLIARAWSKNAETKAEYKPVIEKILDS